MSQDTVRFDAEAFAAPADVDRLQRLALITGAVGLVASLIGLWLAPQYFYRAWLVGLGLFRRRVARLPRDLAAASPDARRLGPGDPPRAGGGVAHPAAAAGAGAAAGLRAQEPLRVGAAGGGAGEPPAAGQGAVPQRALLPRPAGALLPDLGRRRLPHEPPVAAPGPRAVEHRPDAAGCSSSPGRPSPPTAWR